MPNFLPPQPIEENSRQDKWRAVAAVILIFGAVGVLVFRMEPVQKEVVDFSQKVEKLSLNVGNKFSSVGGDVDIPPPEFTPRLPVLKGSMADPEAFFAKSIIVKDQKTGLVLFRKNEYDRRPIASITKLMSALIILENKPIWDATTTVSLDEVVDPHMSAGEEYRIEDLWRAALVGSSNKAIITLADSTGIGRENFIKRMNDKAKELGMTDSTFVDPSGLDEGNISSAADVSILINEALRFQEIKTPLLLKEYSISPIGSKREHHMWNTDWLLLGWIPNTFSDFRGGKTGYIPASGYNFSMQVGDGENHVINVVVLGTDSNENRFKVAKEITDWVFANYEWPQ